MNSQEPEIMDLPDEVLEMIFLKLSRYDIQHNLALVCRRFLNITRRHVFVPSVVIGDSFIDSEMNFPECYLEKIEKVKKVYPNCSIELRCAFFKPWPYDKPRIGYSWMKEFLPYDSSITKLTTWRLEHNWQNTSDFLDFIFLENLESLDLDVSLTDHQFKSKSIQDVEADFWKNFPKLKSLRIKTSQDCPIVEFIDRICSTCRNLESFVHEGSYQCTPMYPKMPFKDEDKFPNLKYIKVEFIEIVEMFRRSIFEDGAILENFRKYLTAKCPNLKNPILMEQTDEEIDYGEVLFSKTFAFESK